MPKISGLALFGIGLDLDTGFWLVLPVAIYILVALRTESLCQASGRKTDTFLKIYFICLQNSTREL